jgi:hypothetical protein
MNIFVAGPPLVDVTWLLPVPHQQTWQRTLTFSAILEVALVAGVCIYAVIALFSWLTM